MGMRRERSVVGYGQVIQTSSRCQSNFILDGASKEDIKNFGFLQNLLQIQNGIMSTPQTINQSQSMGFYPGYYLQKTRAKQSQLLEPKSNWDKAAVGQMIYDNTSSVAQVVKQLISNLSQQALSSNEKEALAVLKKWKGSNNLTDVAPTLYNKWIYTYLKIHSKMN
jgi:penicillin amidase